MSTEGSGLRIGVVGCGRVAQQRHIPIIGDMPQAELRALADVDDKTLNRLARQYGVESAYTDYRELVGSDAIDAVMVAAPTQFHAEVGVAALNAGKHVMIEKPLALSIDEVEKLEAAAAASGKTVAVAMNSRWHRLTREARGIVRGGTLGKIGLLRSVFTDEFRIEETPRPWMMRHDLAGCVLIEQAIHHFDLWAFLLDSEVDDIYAKMEDPMSSSERAAVTATMANGVIVSAMFSEGLKAVNELEIYGEDGRLQVSVYDFDGLNVSPRWEYPGSMGPRLRRLKESLLAFPGAIKRKRTGGDWVGSYRHEWQHFLECIQNGTRPECELEEGKRALRVGLAAMASLSEGVPVRVVDAPREIRSYEGLRR